MPTKSALAVTAEERNCTYETAWNAGDAGGMTNAYTDLITNAAANDTLAQFLRGKIREIVQDPATAQNLMPWDHPVGARRLCLDTNYFSTYNRDNVTLVDVRRSPIQEITANGLRTENSIYELDALVFALGFDAMTGALKNIDIRGRHGRSLQDKWDAGPRTYLGIAVSGFPNLFLLTGPGSPSVLSNMVMSVEQHAEWIAECIGVLNERGLDRIEANLAAEDNWVEHVNALAAATLFPLANSWYLGANIPGKPRIFMPYVGGVGTYRKKCAEVASNGYEGFSLGKVSR
jgi:cyclohexanone monooxygenase